MSHIHRTRLITTAHVARAARRAALALAAVYVWRHWPTDQQTTDYSFARRHQ